MLEYVLIVLMMLIPFLWIIYRLRVMRQWIRLGIPGPKPTFLNGNCADIREKGLPTCHIEWNRSYGEIYGYYVGGTPMLVVGNVNLAKNILKNSFDSFNQRPISSNGFLMGVGLECKQLIFQKNNEWKHQRTAWKTFFNPSNIVELLPKLDKIISASLLQKFAELDSLVKVDIYKHYQNLTLDIIVNLLLGLNNEGTNYSSIMETFKAILNKDAKKNKRSSLYVSTACFPEFDFIIVPSLKVIELVKKHYGTSLSSTFVQQCRELLKRGYENINSNDFPSKLFEAGLNEESVIADCFALFFGGFETISITLLHATHMLVKYPEVQIKLRNEIQKVAENGQYSIEAILKLNYLDYFIKETLRLFNPVPGFIRRKTVVDFEYQSIRIRKGSVIQIPMAMLHKDPKFWSFPEEFNPERFADINGQSDNFTYLPFGGGRRNCVAMHFAMTTMKLTLAKLLTTYNISSMHKIEADLPVAFSIIRVVPKSGISVKLDEI